MFVLRKEATVERKQRKTILQEMNEPATKLLLCFTETSGNEDDIIRMETNIRESRAAHQD
jgi:hypothetical protein